MASELNIARNLIRAFLSNGWTVSVFDGEEYPVKRSTDASVIVKALQSTDSDTLVARKADGELVGSVYLVWGNGEDLISDCSAEGQNADFDKIMKATSI